MEDISKFDSFEILADVVNRTNNQEHIENCLIEEMSELTKAIIKSKRGNKDIKNITEEVGHVILMCNSLIKCYGLDRTNILSEANGAVDRMLDFQLKLAYKQREIDDLTKRKRLVNKGD